MKRLLSLLASVALLSSVGCCCLSTRVNECGPFASDLAGGGGCLAKFARSHGAKKCGCGHCAGNRGMYADPMYGMPYGMETYGGGGCGCDGGMMGGMPAPGSPDCGCGGGGLPQQMIPPAPPAQYAPHAAPTPAPIAEPMPADTPIPAVPEPAAPDAPMTQYQAPAAPNVQNVSVEEFQRLPGTIISGPTTTAVAAPAAGMLARPAVPTAAQPGVRPANWQPAQRTY